MANINYTETEAAQAIQAVLPDSRWIGTGLAKAYLWLINQERSEEAVARHLYERGCFSLTKAREIVPTLVRDGFLCRIKPRTKTGSAENPITKIFPAAITEQRFIEKLDNLLCQRSTVDYEDDRESGHT